MDPYDVRYIFIVIIELIIIGKQEVYGQAKSQCQSHTDNIDEYINLIFEQISESYFEVIYEHNKEILSCWPVLLDDNSLNSVA